MNGTAPVAEVFFILHGTCERLHQAPFPTRGLYLCPCNSFTISVKQSISKNISPRHVNTTHDNMYRQKYMEHHGHGDVHHLVSDREDTSTEEPSERPPAEKNSQRSVTVNDAGLREKY